AVEDSFGRPALVGREYMRHPREGMDLLVQGFPAARTGIAFVAEHDAGPLVLAHGARAAVREQVDEHIGRVELERVITRSLERFEAISGGRHLERFDHLDLEWFGQ